MSSPDASAGPATHSARRRASADTRREHWLDTSSLNRGLADRSRRGAAATSGAQIFRLVTQFGSTIILARLLSPDEYGLVGMVLAIAALADLLTDMGMSQAVIQRKTISHQQVSALFWINVAVGCGLAAALAALSPLVALFYGHPELVGITLVVAPSFLVAGTLVQHQALLQRQMRFASLAARDMAGRTTSIVVATTLAALGAGYWSLAVMPLAGAVARATLVWHACDWRPSRPGRADDLAPMLRFGGSVAGSGFLGYLSRNADNVLVGRFSGPAALGLYSRAYALLLLPLQQVSQPLNVVAIPTLSRLQDQPARYRVYYRAALFTVALLALPLVVSMALLADVLVIGLMGERWDGVIPIFQVLAIAGFAQVISSTATWLWVSRGRADHMLKVSALTRPLTVASFFLGLPWGPVGVAWAVSISSVVTAVPMLYSATRHSSVRMLDILLSIAPPALATVVLAAVILAVRTSVTLSPLAELAVAGTAGAVAYVAVVLAVPSFRQRVRSVVQRRPSGPGPSPAASPDPSPAPAGPVDAPEGGPTTVAHAGPTTPRQVSGNGDIDVPDPIAVSRVRRPEAAAGRGRHRHRRSS